MTRPLSLLLLCLLAALACRGSPTARAAAPDASGAAPPGPLASRQLPAELVTSAIPDGDGKLHVYFLDVGQGDATLVLSPTGRSVLVDTGPAAQAPALAKRLRGLLSAPLDLLVLTRPEPDHAGGLSQVLSSVGARRLLAPLGWSAPAPLSEQLRTAGVELLAPPKAPSQEAAPRISLGGGADLWLLWPAQLPPPSPAAGADLVVRVSFGATSALLASDIPLETEAALLGSGRELRSTVLKVSAHGADRASGAPWLGGVQPLAAVISAGAGNTLGVPSRGVVERLEALPAKVFRTDLDGELHARSDGSHLQVTAARLAAGEAPGTIHTFPPPPKASKPRPDARPARVPPAPATAAAEPAFVASRNGDVFHRPDCRNAKRILPKNLITFATREEAAKERRPAADCKP